MAETKERLADLGEDLTNGGMTNLGFSSPNPFPRSFTRLHGYPLPELDLPGEEEAPSERKMEEKKELTFEDISPFFYVPIAMAAKKLNMGVTQLKKRCRELGIPRWPHRKLKSYLSLSTNVENLIPEKAESRQRNLQRVREILERDRLSMELAPEREIDDETKRLRQACFKAAFKKRKMNGQVAGGKVSRGSSSSSSTSPSGTGASRGDETARQTVTDKRSS